MFLRTPLVLDAALDAAEALRRLREVPPGTAVVVRHRDGRGFRLYTFGAGELIRGLGARGRDGGGEPLGDALSLGPRVPAATRDVAERRPLEDFAGVLLDGVVIVGVVERPVRLEEEAPASAGPGSVLNRLLGGGGAQGRGPTRGRGARRGLPRTAAHPGDVSDGGPDPEPAGSGGPVPRPSFDIGGPMPPQADPGPVSAAAPPSAPDGPPPREMQAHPLLRPERDVVAPGARFEVAVGLASAAVEGVRGTRVALSVPAGADHVDVEVQLVADGFEAPAGWWFRLRVPVANPDAARISVPLVAADDPTPRQCLIEAHFTHEGAPAGVAFCRIAVEPDARGVDEAAGGAEPPVAPGGEDGTVAWIGADASAELMIDPSEEPPDLWITISRPGGGEGGGRFVWSFHSPHGIDLPRRPLPVELGEDARSFAGRVVRLVAENEGTPLIDEALAGLGRLIRDRAPAELAEVISRVAAAVGGPPAVLLQSAEALVPWELALLEEPPDPGAPAFLGAQADLGRWLLGPRSVRVPPARDVEVRTMAVVVGDYHSSRRLRLLPEAEAEGAALAERYAARRLSATAAELNELLGGGPDSAELLHFACHGEIDPRDPAAGRIFLNDDQPLDPIHFLQAPIGPQRAPFLFLNACQVGQAGELLGDYAGFAGSCLRNGFRGFVAPFWSVDDTVAREIALSFYAAAFGGGDGEPQGVGAILRGLRARFPRDAAVPPSTWLAYTFYGNPRLTLRRSP